MTDFFRRTSEAKGKDVLIAGQFEQRLKVARAPDKWFRYIKREEIQGDGAGEVDGASCEGP